MLFLVKLLYEKRVSKLRSAGGAVQGWTDKCEDSFCIGAPFFSPFHVALNTTTYTSLWGLWNLLISSFLSCTIGVYLLVGGCL